MPPLLDSDVTEASPRPLVDSDANSSIGYGNGCNSDGDSVISAIGAGDIPASEALGAANGADGGEVAIAEHGVQIYVDRDATVGQLKAKLAAAQSLLQPTRPLPPRFWNDKEFAMGLPPVAFHCSNDYTRIMLTKEVRAALKECSDSPPTLWCGVVVRPAEAPERILA